MSARVTLQARVEQYLAERRRVGFTLRTMAYGLARFAKYVEGAGHQGPLTVDLMAAWARPGCVEAPPRRRHDHGLAAQEPARTWSDDPIGPQRPNTRLNSWTQSAGSSSPRHATC